jgi:hypothetical protein
MAADDRKLETPPLDNDYEVATKAEISFYDYMAN